MIRVKICMILGLITCSFSIFNNNSHKKIQSFYHRDTKKLIELSKHKMGLNRIVVSCSKPEAFEFDERTSPNEIANLLNCTTWSGAGPGLMDVVTKGALEGGKPVGGFKISKEAGEWTATNFHPYLPSDTYLTCRFFSARKHGLVDCVVRNKSSDSTAVVALPGGIGTLDEVFDILALIQLQRIGSELQVPFLLMNYNSFYTKLLEFLEDCTKWGVVTDGEVSSLWKVCDNNL